MLSHILYKLHPWLWVPHIDLYRVIKTIGILIISASCVVQALCLNQTNYKCYNLNQFSEMQDSIKAMANFENILWSKAVMQNFVCCNPELCSYIVCSNVTTHNWQYISIIKQV